MVLHGQVKTIVDNTLVSEVTQNSQNVHTVLTTTKLP